MLENVQPIAALVFHERPGRPPVSTTEFPLLPGTEVSREPTHGNHRVATLASLDLEATSTTKLDADRIDAGQEEISVGAPLFPVDSIAVDIDRRQQIQLEP